MKPPMVHNTYVSSFDELESILEHNYPGLKLNPSYEEWIMDARAHSRLYNARIGNHCITPKELRQISRDMNIPRNKAEGWIHEGKLPQIYRMMEVAMTRDDGSARAKILKGKLSGAFSFDAMKSRLDTFYLKPELESLKGFNMHEKNANSFYALVDALPEGGLKRDLVKHINATRNAERWMDGDLPRLPRIASEIPEKAPRDGCRWLPLEVKGKSFSNWIQVPETVETVEDVKMVLDQLKPIENREMKRWQKKYGRVSKEEAFMYSLGVLCSDGSLYRGSMIERFGLNLSKRYEWSGDFGDATCYYLGCFGLESGRISDNSSEYVWKGEIRVSEKYCWISQSSALLNWVKRSVLGFELEGSKQGRLNVGWIVESPEEWRKSFIRGIADGDGWVGSMRPGISTTEYSEIYKKILDSFGMDVYVRDNGIIFTKKADITKAAQLPLFRHALSRLRKLRKLAMMYKVSGNAGHMSDPEKELIYQLSIEGLGPGEMRNVIWEELGISRSILAISRFLKNHDDSSS